MYLKTFLLWFDHFLDPWAEICQIFRWFFGKFNKIKKTFWNYLTFRVLLNKMMSAVNKNNVDLVKRLLANGTDANYGKTALMYAAFGYKWRVYGTFASQVWPKSNWQLWINCMPYIMQSFMEIIKLLSFSNNISIMYVFSLFSPQKPTL